MNLELQEWLALAIVIAVTGYALWQRRTHNRSKGCNDCSLAQCRPSATGKPRMTGVNPDPYRPQLYRPLD